MIRGVSFTIPNGCEKVFKLILSNIDIGKYSWFNIESEDQVFILNENNDFLFSETCYNGNEFDKLINDNDYYVVFVELQAYFSTEMQEINTYNDFIRSACEIVIIITDEVFASVYARNSDVIEVVKNNAMSNRFSEIEYITDENDTRTTFCAI